MRALMRFSERVMCLDEGKVICEGSPAQIVADPQVRGLPGT